MPSDFLANALKRRGIETEAPAKKPFAVTIEYALEEDGRWIADVPEYPGVMVYGKSRYQAGRRVLKLLEAVLAEQLKP